MLWLSWGRHCLLPKQPSSLPWWAMRLLFAPDDAGQHAQSAVLTQLARVVSVQALDPGRWERL
jgi:hypothetical protein